MWKINTAKAMTMTWISFLLHVIVAFDWLLAFVFILACPVDGAVTLFSHDHQFFKKTINANSKVLSLTIIVTYHPHPPNNNQKKLYTTTFFLTFPARISGIHRQLIPVEVVCSPRVIYGSERLLFMSFRCVESREIKSFKVWSVSGMMNHLLITCRGPSITELCGTQQTHYMALRVHYKWNRSFCKCRSMSYTSPQLFFSSCIKP